MTVVPMKFRDCDDPRRHDLWTTPSRLPELNDLGLLTAVLRCPNREKVARALLARFRGFQGSSGPMSSPCAVSKAWAATTSSM